MDIKLPKLGSGYVYNVVLYYDIHMGCISYTASPSVDLGFNALLAQLLKQLCRGTSAPSAEVFAVATGTTLRPVAHVCGNCQHSGKEIRVQFQIHFMINTPMHRETSAEVPSSRLRTPR